MTDPLDCDAVGQAELVRSGEVTPLQLTEGALARIDARNGDVNAVIHRFDDKALAAATDLDTAGAEGPFAGVPFLMKDAVAHTGGDPYHLGMRFLKERNWTEPSDTWLAARFRSAGFVFVGKTNTPELAATMTTEPLAYGPTRNPWDLAHSTGGSSGGSAAAVAAGMVAAAHGNDMGGSIRAPASECGLVGLKPSRGRTSLGPDFGDYWGPLTHEGVLTRTVRDTAAILDAISGNAPGDPYTAPPFTRPLADEVGADPGCLRIGLRTALPGSGEEAHPDCVAAVEATGRLLEQLGHQVSTVSPAALDRADVLGGPLGTLVCVALGRELDRWSARVGEPIGAGEVEPNTWMMAEIGRAVTAPQLFAVTEAMWIDVREMLAWWLDSDVLVTPTLGLPPPELGVLAPDADPQSSLPVLAKLAAFLGPWNLTGQPAVSLPLHRNDAGLPIGVQFVAGYGREDVLIRLASQLEQAQPWPLSAEGPGSARR